MFCYGHMHDFQQKSQESFSDGITLSLQAGTLDYRNENSGYSIISLSESNNLNDGRVLYRKYDKDSTLFSPWDARCKDGLFDFSTGDFIKFDSRKFSELSKNIISSINKELIVNTGLLKGQEKSISSLFVEPNLETPSFCGMPTIKSTALSTIDAVFNAKGCSLILGGGTSGKTFLLKYMFFRGLERQVSHNFTRFYFYFDMADVDIKNKNNIMGFLCGQYHSSEIDSSFEHKVKTMIFSGNATIIIDNFSISDTRKYKYIIDFIEDNINCNYILSADEDSGVELSGCLSNIKEIELHLSSIGMLKRKDVRLIVKNWASLLPVTCENVIYNEVTKLVNNSQLPHNHFVYSMLLAIYENTQDINNILNESDVIENFIEVLLKKHCMDIPSSKPQYKTLIHFMGFVSKKYFENSSISRKSNEVFSDAIEFNKLTHNSFELNDYINPMISSGIMVRRNGFICFSQITFLYYFLSYFMKHDSELKNKILSDDKYLELDKVVEYFASQHSSDLSLLVFIKEKIDESKTLISSCISNEKGIDIENTSIDDLGGVSILDVASSIEDIEDKIERIKIDRNKDDDKLDKVMPLNKNGNDKINFSESENINDDIRLDFFVSKLKHQLSLYSRVFRSTELVMDSEKVLSVYDDILSGYIYATKAAIVGLDDSFIIPMFIQRMSEDKFMVDQNEIEKREIIRQLKALLSIVRSAMPNHIQNIMSYDLCSKKPRISNITESSLSNSSDYIKSCFMIYLLIDMNEGDIRKHVKSIMRYKQNFAKTTLFFKIMQMISRDYALTTSDIQFLKTTANKLVSDNKIGLKNKLELFNKALNISN